MQRLNFASEGTKFTKQKKDRGKYLYIKLSPNKKMICFGDWTDHESVPEIENLEGKLPVCDIKALVTGNECLTGNNKDTRRGNKDDTDRYLTIMSDNVNLEIIAPDAKSFDYWCDAINALLRKEMVSSRMVQDLDLLTGMEIRLRLLDIEGIKLPDKAPIIPPPPPTFDFVS
jgi:engulfment/cell motility protein 1